MKKQHILVIFKLFIGWKGVATLEVICCVTCMYKFIIYGHLDGNKISVIKDNTFNNLTSLNTL
jgi:hypothetical protein